jgi:hypothetical protein
MLPSAPENQTFFAQKNNTLYRGEIQRKVFWGSIAPFPPQFTPRMIPKVYFAGIKTKIYGQKLAWPYGSQLVSGRFVDS